MNVTNWQHHSSKSRKKRGCCKAQIKARKQALQALKRKLKAAKP